MSKTQLTDLQLDLMRVLWERGEATVAEVRDELAGRDLALTTVATVLSRLEKQDVVARRMEGSGGRWSTISSARCSTVMQRRSSTIW